jgi:peptidyl-prolyl cis-trans isomerase D
LKRGSVEISKASTAMLASMRKGAGTWVARIFLFVLVASFGIWGIGDFVRGTGDRSVATVGSLRIDASTFDRQYRRELQQLQDQLRGALNAEQARKLGLADNTLRQMITRSLVDQDAARLGIIVGDQTVVEEVHNNTAFRNSFGKFDEFTFERVIRSQGWSRAAFAEIVRGDIARGMLVGAVGAGAQAAPKLMVDTLYGYRSEQRVADLLLVKRDAVGPIADPDAATLEQYHKDHAAEFSAPEYRTFSYIGVTPEDLAGEAQVSDQEIKDEYEARKDTFVVQEKRTVEQAVFASEAAAKAAYDKIKGGGDFTTVSKEIGGQPPIAFNLVTKSGLQPEVADAAFKLDKGAISEPVKTGLGWDIVRVSEIAPGSVRALDEVKSELRRELALRAATDIAPRKLSALQDELAGGATLAQAAEKLRLKLTRIDAVDATGTDPAGKTVENLPRVPNLLQNVFDAAVGADQQTFDTDDGGSYLLKVEGSTPPALRPLASIRDKVLAAWKAETGAQAATSKAKEIAEKLKAGADLAALAKDIGGSVVATKPLMRDGSGADATIPATLLAGLFKAKPGEVVTASLPDNGGAVVAKLTRVIAADPSANPKAKEQLAQSIGNGLANDLIGEYQAALERDIGVTINRAVLDTIL